MPKPYFRSCFDECADQSIYAKPPAALPDASDWLLLLAGDNGAELEFSRSRQRMRRQPLLGRSTPATIHMNASASIRLLEHPGLLPLMQAFRLYREARWHEFAHSPSECFWILLKTDPGFCTGFLQDTTEAPLSLRASCMRFPDMLAFTEALS